MRSAVAEAAWTLEAGVLTEARLRAAGVRHCITTSPVGDKSSPEARAAPG